MIKIFSKGIKKLSNLDLFIKEELSQYNHPTKEEVVIGWGHKKTAEKARKYAKNHNLPYIALEDGLIRSLDLGVNGAIPYSISVDNVGCYYDCTKPSKIEKLLEDASWYDEKIEKDASFFIAKITRLQISKYNCASDAPSDLIENKEKSLLIVDQTFNDASLILGKAKDDVFKRMLDTAKEKFSDYTIYIKTHPDVLSGKKQGLFKKELLDDSKFSSLNIKIIKENYRAISILKQFSKVFVATSQMGFEALLLNKDVYCFALPFYAGYGLTKEIVNTNDLEIAAILKRRKKLLNVSINKLFVATYLKLCRYVNPITKMRVSLNEILDLIDTQYRVNEENKQNYVVFNVKGWKQEILRAFLGCTDTRYKVYFTKSYKKALSLCKEYNATLVQWASKKDFALEKEAQSLNIKTLNVEDGFLRSKGLGATYNKPMSLVFDDLGIYYDPRYPSRLEDIFNNIASISKIEKEELDIRANKLKDFILSRGLTKYNVGTSIDRIWDEIKEKAQGKKIILVPGQVEGDASVKYGGLSIHSNLDLLKKVREWHKDSFIIYKPHPDVLALARVKSEITLNAVKEYCDYIIYDVSINDLYKRVDEIHTLTSQSGFEALLRDVKVFVYGMPFYASWNLTEDYKKETRRKQKLSLNDLLIGTYFLYPRYYDWNTHLICRVEDICNLLTKETNTKSHNVLAILCRLQGNIKSMLFNKKDVL